MGYEILPLTKLIEHFERLPGVGKKSAQRLAFYVLNMPKEMCIRDSVLTALLAHGVFPIIVAQPL